LRLPLRDSLAVHGIMTAGVLGLLLYPFSLFLCAATLVALARGNTPDSFWMWFMLTVNGVNLVTVLVAATISAWRGLRAAGAIGLSPLITALPIYWMLMSLAAWQALRQLLIEPSRWEKTSHGVARNRRTPGLQPGA
jgi:hypothetical protein